MLLPSLAMSLTLFSLHLLLLLLTPSPALSGGLLPTALTPWYARPDILHRHEYKHSFCAPKLTLGSESRIAFWRYGGDAIATLDSLRIVPSIRSRQGFVWNEQKLTIRDWEIDMAFRVSGRLRQGADGMAVWLTEEQMGRGAAFGSNDVWKGIGIILDSFDNDALKDNPKVQLVVNDGTHRYNHQLDGKPDELASCMKDYRNQPYAVRLKIIKVDNIIQVWIHPGYTLNPDYEDYDLCIQSQIDPFAAADGYLGVSAATGGLSDDHDVMCFTLHSLTQREAGPDSELNINATSEEDSIRERVNKIYSEFDKEFSEKRSKFQQEHPDLVDNYPVEDFESSVESKLRQLLDRQGGMMKEIISAKVSSGSSESLLNSIARDIKNIERLISDLKSVSGENPDASSEPQGSLHTVSRDVKSLHDTLRDLRSSLDRTLTQLVVQINEQKGQRVLPSGSNSNVVCTGCVGFWGMFLFMCFQLIVFSCFVACLRMKEERSKKYF